MVGAIYVGQSISRTIMGLTRRETLERIIISSVLTTPEYFKDVRILSSDMIEDLINREIFALLKDIVPRAIDGKMMPLEVLWQDYKAGKVGNAVMIQALEITAMDYDFDANKAYYNVQALADYFLGYKLYRPTDVRFADYITQFIKYDTSKRL